MIWAHASTLSNSALPSGHQRPPVWARSVESAVAPGVEGSVFDRQRGVSIGPASTRSRYGGGAVGEIPGPKPGRAPIRSLAWR